MISFLTHKFPISKKEIWYYNNEAIQSALYNTYAYSFIPPPKNSLINSTTKTIWTNLEKTEGDIFNEFNSTTKNEIRKAEKENASIDIYTTIDINKFKQLITDFKLFSEQRNILAINSRRLIALRKINALVVTKSFQENQESATHIYLLAKNIALLIYSYNNPELSENKSHVNRFHHWKDILYFKKNNLKFYDWGGIDETLVGISSFKKSFGGEEKTFYNFIECNPFLFKIIKAIR